MTAHVVGVEICALAVNSGDRMSRGTVIYSVSAGVDLSLRRFNNFTLMASNPFPVHQRREKKGVNQSSNFFVVGAPRADSCTTRFCPSRENREAFRARRRRFALLSPAISSLPEPRW